MPGAVSGSMVAFSSDLAWWEDWDLNWERMDLHLEQEQDVSSTI